MANFIKNFKNQNNVDGFLPESVLNYLNDQWEGKLKYQYIDDAYILTPTEERIEIKIENFSVENLDEIEKVCGKKNIPLNEIFKYSYNSQKPIVLKPLDDFAHYVNDIKVDIEKMGIYRQGQVNFKEGKIILVPEKMNNKISIKIGNGEESHKHDLIQKPIDSLDKKLFVTSNTSKIHIEFVFEETKVKCHMRVNDKNIDSYEEYITVLEFMQSMFDKGMFINDSRIFYPQEKTDDYNSREELINFYKMVVEIEKKLETHFPVKSITNTDYENVYLLYNTLVLKKPVKKYQNILNLSYDKAKLVDEEIDELKKHTGKKIFVEYYETKTLKLFSQELELCQIKAIFNLMVESVEENSKENKLYVNFKNNEEKKFISILIFKDMDELRSFQEVEDHVNQLYNAIELKELINKYH